MTKTKKPKSVDEAWILEECHSGIWQISYVIDKADLKIKREKINEMERLKKFYRIRKWRAEKVCEWKEDPSEAGWYITGCGLLVGHRNKFCGNCGGKIKVIK